MSGELQKRFNSKGQNQQQVDDEAVRAYEMRVAGMRNDQIMKALNISWPTLHKRLKRGTELVISPVVEEYRELVGARLDTTLNALLRDNPRMTPDVAASIVKIEDRRAKLYGLDAAIKVEQTLTLESGGIDEEVARLAAELGLTEAVAHGSDQESDEGDDLGSEYAEARVEGD